MTTSVSGIDVLGNAVSSGKDSATSKTKLFDDMEAFLFLLTQQLKYQDPLDPMDTSEYTNQLVQYAQVEQSIQSNTYLETIVAQNVNAVATQAISYMDQYVQALGNGLPLQDGNAKFSYVLGSDASSCVVAIKDASGSFVKTFTGVEQSAGRHEMVWDGKDNYGNQLNDGAYSLVVTALDSTGSAVEVQTTVFGKVTGVAYDGDSVAIGMGNVATDMNSILAVHSKSDIVPASTEEGTQTV
ncbi:MAG: flagellar hook assembly protein FlgD [Alphaproteobacteria bacterium]|nr:flagellar hook assembly protein FlgD [Alphaproteobacteria bacterium]MBO4644580.1 flagellar hook assembly protein FlgD [Alphaproteobacteria bacterium]